MTEPTTMQTWERWARSVPAFHAYELTLAGYADQGDADHGDVMLMFTSPHQSDDDIHAITECAQAHLDSAPARFRDGTVVVTRQNINSAGSDTPPTINVELVCPRPVDFDTWNTWVSRSPVLTEFGLRLSYISHTPETRPITLVLTSTLGEANIDALRDRKPHLLTGLPEQYAGADITITPHDQANNDDIQMTITPPPFLVTDTAPRMRYGWERAIDTVLIKANLTPEPWRTRVAAAAILITAAILAYCAGTIITAIVLGSLSLLGEGLNWMHDGYVAQVVLGPVRSWLDAQSAGMPVNDGNTYWLWAAIGIITGLLGTLSRNTGARIGWVLWGAATVYITYHGTSIPSQLVAAGVAATWWVAFSFLVFRRRGGLTRIIAHIPGLITDYPSGHLTSLHALDMKSRRLTAKMRDLVTRTADPADAEQDDDADPARRWSRNPETGGYLPPPLPLPIFEATEPTMKPRDGFGTSDDLDDEQAHWENSTAAAGLPGLVVHDVHRSEDDKSKVVHMTMSGTTTTGAEKARWERLTDDADLPGMIFHGRFPAKHGKSTLVHYELPDAGLAIDDVIRAASHIELLLFKRFRDMFDGGHVWPGCVTVQHATDADGNPVLSEIFLCIATAKPVNGSYQDTKDVIREIVTAAGPDGVTGDALHRELQQRGYRIERAALYPWMARLCQERDGATIYKDSSRGTWTAVQPR